MNKQDAIDITRFELKQLGFKKIRNSWYEVLPNFYVVFNIQTSIYESDTYYINIAATPIELYQGKFIPEYKCELRRRCDKPNGDVNKCIDKMNELISNDLSDYKILYASIQSKNKDSWWIVTKQMKSIIDSKINVS